MENKTSKYFKYAFGEILLVVIGILIALSINNWNQNRQNKKILKIYTEQPIEEIDLNIKQLETVISEETLISKQLDTLLDLLNKEDLENPKLSNKSFALLSFEDFHPETIAYDNLKASGEFKLIEDIELRNAISNAYNTFESVALTQELHYFNMKTRIADYFYENVDFGNISSSSNNFAKDKKFKNLALGAFATVKQKITSCENSAETLEQLKVKLTNFKAKDL